MTEVRYPVAIIQYFRGGQRCDETGRPRSSVVYVSCCKDSKLKIKSLQEAEICSYTISMCSSALCDVGFQEEFVRHDPYLGIDLLKGQCFKYTKEWWTYEVCVGKAAKQYHLNQERQAGDVAEEFWLGTFQQTWQENLPPYLSKDDNEASKQPLYVDNSTYNKGLLQLYDDGKK